MRNIGSMWKFKLKRDSTGNITKYKARLVARGDQQEPDALVTRFGDKTWFSVIF